MARITLIESPGSDEALKAVRARLTGPLVEEVRVLHNSDPSGPGTSGPQGLVAALKKLEPKLKPNTLESIDLVGHGAPGTIRVGATSAGTAKVQTSFQTVDWAMLDSDVAKFESLSEAAVLVRTWQEAGLTQANFQIRLIGCNTAVDPGIVPEGLLTTLQDGAAFIHLLASFFDVEVAGTLGYIGVESFDANGFTQTAVLRSCRCGVTDSEVTFTPATVPTTSSGYSDTKVGTLAIAPLTMGLHPQLRALLDYYEPQATELKTRLPLVVRDESVPVPDGALHLVEEGKAILFRKGQKLYRTKVRPEWVLEAQHATLAYLARPGGPAEKAAPAWASRVAPKRSTPPPVRQINRGSRPPRVGAP